MTRPQDRIAIDARPAGPGGMPLAQACVLGEPVLRHHLRLARQCGAGSVTVHAATGQADRLLDLAGPSDPTIRWTDVAPGPDALVLRTDRLYELRSLRRAVRRAADPDAVAVWRLDAPGGLEHADSELVRRQSYQPLGHYWALKPARALARRLSATAVRPNHLTLAAACCVFGAAALVAVPGAGSGRQLLIAGLLALGLVLDTADGHLARLQGTASAFGRWLDSTLDEVGDHLLHAAIGWSAFVATGQPAWLLLTTLYSAGKAVFQFANGLADTDLAPSRPPAEVRPQPVPARPPSGLRRLVELAGHADLRWHLWIVLALIGQLPVALVAYALYFPARFVAGTVGKAVRYA